MAEMTNLMAETNDTMDQEFSRQTMSDVEMEDSSSLFERRGESSDEDSYQDKISSGFTQVIAPSQPSLLPNWLGFKQFKQILKETLSPDLFDLYRKSIKVKQNTLISIEFGKHKIDATCVKDPSSPIAFSRKGYRLTFTYEFYRQLKDRRVLIRDINDFKLFILPVFYLIHGEAYSSLDDSKYEASYCIVTTKKQVNIRCLKCKSNPFSTLNIEFTYGDIFEDVITDI